tara:strand:- start:536 stop:1441 length:906 start_codon:yes stop_codon:yes gene_type:complete
LLIANNKFLISNWLKHVETSIHLRVFLMKNFKLAAIQLDTIACEVNYNVHKAMHWTRQAFEQGADYVFLHEGLTADYTPDPIRYGRSLQSAEVFGFISLAKRYGGYVSLGLNEVYQGKAYICMAWLGPEGIVGAYRKSYLWPNPIQLGEGGFEKWQADYVPHEMGYRCERCVLGAGEGTVVMDVGELRIGCIICADGSQPEAWETFEKDRPDLIFWQNNRGNVAKDEKVPHYAKKLKAPMIANNRVGFSYHHFQSGGTIMVADNGSTVAKANETGEEEMIFANYLDLKKRSSKRNKSKASV